MGVGDRWYGIVVVEGWKGELCLRVVMFFVNIRYLFFIIKLVFFVFL